MNYYAGIDASSEASSLCVVTARAKPGKLTLASAGPTTVTQIAFEMRKRGAKADITFGRMPGPRPPSMR